jgi:hypothetical protein
MSITTGSTPVEKEVTTVSARPRACGASRWMIPTTGTYRFVGAADGTVVYRNGASEFTLQRHQLRTANLTTGDIISTNNNLLVFALNGTTGLAYAWSGYIFGHRVDRYIVTAYMTATEKDGIVNVYRDGQRYDEVNLSVDTLTTLSLPDGDNQYTFYSNVPICIFTGEVNSSDTMPLYPCEENIVYGCASSNGHMIAVFNNTGITEYATNGNINGRPTLNAGAQNEFSNDGGSQFTGPSVALSSNKPLAAESQADADGGEMTPFVGRQGFGNLFAIPENQRDFTKFYSNAPAVISAYNSSGFISETTMTGSANGGGIYDAYITGSASYEGVVYETSELCTAIYEGEEDDETILAAFDTTETVTEVLTSENRYLISHNPGIVSDQLSFYVDSGNLKSYPGTGSEWKDLVNDRIMTLNGGYTFADGILNFNTTSYAEIPTNADVQVPGTSFSLNVWFKPLGSSSGNDDYGRIFCIDSPNGNGFGNWTISYDENNEFVRFGYLNPSSGVGNNEIYNANHLDGLEYGKWFNYQSTFNADTGLLKLYRNGILISQGVGSETIYGLPATSSINCRIGASDGIVDHWSNTAIPIAGVYKKELSEDEVWQNYKALKGRFLN